MTDQRDDEMPFKRGQVWENPDGELMMIRETVSYNIDNERRHKIHYVTEDGETGKFFSCDKAIVNNITRADATITPEQVDTVRRALENSIRSCGYANSYGVPDYARKAHIIKAKEILENTIAILPHGEKK